MRKVLIGVLVLALALVASAGPNIMQTATIAFTNETVAKTDTMQADDSLFFVLDQRVNGRLADKIAIYIPDVLASGDSVAIDLQLLPQPLDGADYSYVNSNTLIPSRNRVVGDNVRAPKSTGSSVVTSLTLDASWKYGDGAVSVKWSPPDSAICNRVCLVLREIATTGNTVQITGCDSLTTSTARAVWILEEDDD